MDYITVLNSFWDFATLNPLPTGQVALYTALTHICNRNYWAEWFSAPNQVLSVLTGLSRSGILKARNELKQKGLIDFRERGTKATLYKLTIVKSKQASTQDSVQDSKQDGVQNGTPINKNEKQRRKTDDNPPISPVQYFEEFLQAYPKQGCNRASAEHAYCKILRADCHLAEQDLVAAAKNYAEAVRILGRQQDYIRSPESFLRDNFFAEYLPGEYVRPKVEKGKSQNSFNQFQQNSYDFGQLEDELLANG